MNHMADSKIQRRTFLGAVGAVLVGWKALLSPRKAMAVDTPRVHNPDWAEEMNSGKYNQRGFVVTHDTPSAFLDAVLSLPKGAKILNVGATYGSLVTVAWGVPVDHDRDEKELAKLRAIANEEAKKVGLRDVMAGKSDGAMVRFWSH